MIYDVVIIGGGPAGLTAGINLQRAGKNAIIIEKSTPGGQLINIDTIHNYPGVINENGIELALKIYSQVELPIEIGEVIDINFLDPDYQVITTDQTYLTKSIIVATGTSNLMLGLPYESQLLGKGLSFCASCDGALYQDQEVIVYGQLNKAIDEALYLAPIVKKLTLITPKEHFSKSVSRLAEYDHVTILYQTKLTKLNITDQKLQSVETDQGQIINGQGLFVYQGYVPQTKFLKDLVEIDQQGFIVVNQQYQTKLPRLYAIGDCVSYPIKQLATAVGMASSATIFLLKELNRKQ